MADSSVFTTDLGAVTAYADAKAHGYTGTREEFGELLANAGSNLTEAEAAKAARAGQRHAGRPERECCGGLRQGRRVRCGRYILRRGVHRQHVGRYAHRRCR